MSHNFKTKNKIKLLVSGIALLSLNVNAQEKAKSGIQEAWFATAQVGDKTTITNFSLAHVATTESIYNSLLGGSNPTLTTPLSFGFKFVF